MAVTSDAGGDDAVVHIVEREQCICGTWGEALLVTRGDEVRWEIVCLNARCWEPAFPWLEDHGICAKGCGRVFADHGPYQPIPDYTPLCDYCLHGGRGSIPPRWRRS